MRYMPLEKKELSCADMQAVILMGGLGKRLEGFTKDRPKPLIPVNGKPFFAYEFELLLAAGFKKFVFLTGYRAGMIEKYFGGGSRYGADVSIQYSYDGDVPLGTGGAVVKALPLLEEDFLLAYADSYMDVDYFEIVYRYFLGRQEGCRALMTVMENCGQFDRSNAVCRDGRLQEYDKKNTTDEMSYIDYGIEVFSREVFENLPENKIIDLADIQHDLAGKGECAACEQVHRFYEIGTPAALEEFQRYAWNRFEKPHAAVFLDRDGIINEIVFNEDTQQLDSPLAVREFRFLPGVLDSLKALSDSGADIFIVTNQPAAAKGKAVLAELYDINLWMAKQLLKSGICVSGISMCPHHPSGDRRSRERFLVKKCSCRKPEPGMIAEILNKHNIDRKRSYMVGDSYTDMAAGKKAGVGTIFAGSYKCDACAKLAYNKPDFIVETLSEAVEIITGRTDIME